MLHVVVDFTEEQLENQLISAVEGGSTYWCKSIRAFDSDGAPATELYACLQAGGWWNVKEHDPSGVKLASVTLDTLQSSLTVLAEKYTHHFRDIMDDAGDAWTGDALLQCAVFGDIIYG